MNATAPISTIVYIIVLHCTGIATFIVLPFYLYVVIYKSTQQMATYRNLWLISAVFSTLITVIYSTTVPMYHADKGEKLLHGVVCHLSSPVFEAATAIIVNFSCNINNDLLLVMLINRYDLVSKNIVTPNRLWYTFIYTFIGISNAVECSAISAIIASHYFPENFDETFCNYDKIVTITSAFFHFTRLSGFVTVVYMNVKFGVKYAYVLSPHLLRIHRMLTKTVIANVISTMLFTRLPLLAVFLSSMTHGMKLVFFSLNIMIACANSAFFADILITLYFVTPYRRFVSKLFKKHNNTVIFVPSFVEK
uniref:G_PROTEIN_RECEP_F1_2 domain-containing protein n=1 Tax=Panagrellus redivivus TaxID=6233 RepID=A0A7E4ZSN2_PANRE